MPAKSVFYNTVKYALEKDGWLIANDPLFLRFGGLDMYVDLGAEKILAAERNEEKIAVEIKSFIAPSATTEFSTALGQFLKCPQAGSLGLHGQSLPPQAKILS
jgi:XisH protein